LGNEEVEALSNFPERIELNDRWHNRLNEIKKESYDGLERWLPVGMKQDRSLDFLPENSQKGFYTHVTPLTADQIKEKYGIVHNIGEIHTHPSDWFNS
jgi:hypothetical protein